jgi:hypothetical protein
MDAARICITNEHAVALPDATSIAGGHTPVAPDEEPDLA